MWLGHCDPMQNLGHEKWSNQYRGVSMDEHTTKCDIEMGKNREKVKHIVHPNPKEK